MDINMNDSVNAKVLDSTLLCGYVESLGVDIVKQMMELYQQQSALYLKEINAALKLNTQVSWQESCHKMKGAAGSVGLKEVHSFLVSIEKSTVDQREKEDFLVRLNQLNEHGIAAFQYWLKIV